MKHEKMQHFVYPKLKAVKHMIFTLPWNYSFTALICTNTVCIFTSKIWISNKHLAKPPTLVGILGFAISTLTFGHRFWCHTMRQLFGCLLVASLCKVASAQEKRPIVTTDLVHGCLAHQMRGISEGWRCKLLALCGYFWEVLSKQKTVKDKLKTIENQWLFKRNLSRWVEVSPIPRSSSQWKQGDEVCCCESEGLESFCMTSTVLLDWRKLLTSWTAWGRNPGKESGFWEEKEQLLIGMKSRI